MVCGGSRAVTAPLRRGMSGGSEPTGATPRILHAVRVTVARMRVARVIRRRSGRSRPLPPLMPRREGPASRPSTCQITWQLSTRADAEAVSRLQWHAASRPSFIFAPLKSWARRPCHFRSPHWNSAGMRWVRLPPLDNAGSPSNASGVRRCSRRTPPAFRTVAGPFPSDPADAATNIYYLYRNRHVQHKLRRLLGYSFPVYPCPMRTKRTDVAVDSPDGDRAGPARVEFGHGIAWADPMPSVSTPSVPVVTSQARPAATRRGRERVGLCRFDRRRSRGGQGRPRHRLTRMFPLSFPAFAPPGRRAVGHSRSGPVPSPRESTRRRPHPLLRSRSVKCWKAAAYLSEAFTGPSVQVPTGPGFGVARRRRPPHFSAPSTGRVAVALAFGRHPGRARSR